MNDIATAALWLAALAMVARPLACGALVGAAILVRPNLAPLAAIVAAMAWRPGQAWPWRSTAWLVAGAVPGMVAWLWLNHVLYGSVIGSGYGDAGRLFSVANIDANAANYGKAFYQTQTIFPLLALAAPLALAGEARRLALWLLVFVGVMTAIYFLYAVPRVVVSPLPDPRHRAGDCRRVRRGGAPGGSRTHAGRGGDWHRRVVVDGDADGWRATGAGAAGAGRTLP